MASLAATLVASRGRTDAAVLAAAGETPGPPAGEPAEVGPPSAGPKRTVPARPGGNVTQSDLDLLLADSRDDQGLPRPKLESASDSEVRLDLDQILSTTRKDGEGDGLPDNTSLDQADIDRLFH